MSVRFYVESCRWVPPDVFNSSEACEISYATFILHVWLENFQKNSSFKSLLYMKEICSMEHESAQSSSPAPK